MTRVNPIRLLVSVLISASASAVYAQGSQFVGQPWTGPKGIELSVRDIMLREAITPRPAFYMKRTEKDGPDRRELPQNPASQSVSQWPVLSPTPSAPIRPATPFFSEALSFTGVTSAESAFVPPDTMGDVSRNQVLVVINGRIKVFNKAGVLGALDADLDTFFSSVHGGPGVADPRCRYDRLSNRWIVTAMSLHETNNRMVLAVSNNASISGSGSFTFYQFQHNVVSPAGDNNRFFDYPSLGVDQNALYIGGNLFQNSSFVNTSAFVVRKSSILSGGPIVVSAFRSLIGGSSGMFTPQGVDNDNPNATEGYFIGVDQYSFGKLTLRRVSNPGGTPTMSPDVFLTVPSTSFPRAVPAPGSSAPLDALDDRLLVAKIHRNRLTGENSLWTSHSISVTGAGVPVDGTSSSARAATRWYQIQNYETVPSLVQSGTVYNGGSSSTATANFMGSIAATRQGHALVGYTRAGPVQNASTGMSFRLGTDPLGAMSAPATLFSGQSGYNLGGGSPLRWGDYSHTVVDPSDGMTVWTFQEFCSATNTFAVRVHKLLAPPPATIDSITPNTAGQGRTLDITVDGSAVNGSGFFDGGSAFPNRIRSTFSGLGVTVNSTTWVSPTALTINVTVAPGAALGPRKLTITNPDNQKSSLVDALTVTSASLPISGRVKLEDYVVTAAKVTITALIREAGTLNTLETVTFKPYAYNGNFTFNTTLPPGTYDIAFHGPTWLRKKVAGVAITGSGATDVRPILTNGNATGNAKLINQDDRNFVTSRLGLSKGDTNYQPRADIDGSKTINAADVAIVDANMGMVGDD